LMLLLPFISGCAATRYAVLPDLEIVDIPMLEEVNQVELGDTIVSKGKIYTYDALELRNNVSAGDGFFISKWSVPAGILLAKQEDSDWIYYYSDGFTNYTVGTGNLSYTGGLKVSKKDDGKILIFMIGDLNSLNPKPKPDFIQKKVDAVDRPSFRQELIYNGRTGNDVKGQVHFFL